MNEALYKDHDLNWLMASEVAQIEDEDISKFVKETLNFVQPYHRLAPASSTGKYHPQYANGIGGLIRHVKVTVMNMQTIIRSTPALEREKDTLIAAAILHDFFKYPKGEESEYTAFDHPKLMGDYCTEHGFPEIGRLIAAHQGIWTRNDRQMPGFENEQPRKFDEWCLHYSDLFASRTYLQVEFDEVGEIIIDPKSEKRAEAVQEKKDAVKAKRRIAE